MPFQPMSWHSAAVHIGDAHTAVEGPPRSSVNSSSPTAVGPSLGADPSFHDLRARWTLCGVRPDASARIRFTPRRDTAWRARWRWATSRGDGDAWADSPVAATVLSALRHPVRAAARRPALLPPELQDAGLSSTAAGGGRPAAGGRLADVAPLAGRRRARHPRRPRSSAESYWNRVGERIGPLQLPASDKESP